MSGFFGARTGCNSSGFLILLLFWSVGEVLGEFCNSGKSMLPCCFSTEMFNKSKDEDV